MAPPADPVQDQAEAFTRDAARRLEQTYDAIEARGVGEDKRRYDGPDLPAFADKMMDKWYDWIENGTNHMACVHLPGDLHDCPGEVVWAPYLPGLSCPPCVNAYMSSLPEDDPANWTCDMCGKVVQEQSELWVSSLLLPAGADGGKVLPAVIIMFGICNPCRDEG